MALTRRFNTIAQLARINEYAPANQPVHYNMKFYLFESLLFASVFFSLSLVLMLIEIKAIYIFNSFTFYSMRFTHTLRIKLTLTEAEEVKTKSMQKIEKNEKPSCE